MGKAWAALLVGRMLDPSGWGIVVAAALVIIGHAWPITTEFRGGMGMACGIAILGYLAPLGLFLTLVAWGIWLGIFRHFPRSQAAAALTAPAILWVLGSPLQVLAAGLASAAVLLIRHLHDLGRRTLTLGLR
jgi:glycerol-3-phosphate acyltransferase PlsY